MWIVRTYRFVESVAGKFVVRQEARFENTGKDFGVWVR